MTRILDPIQEIAILRTLSKRTQARFLTTAEDLLIHDPMVYQKIRKLYLDCTMDFTRDLANEIVGDVEDLVR